MNELSNPLREFLDRVHFLTEMHATTHKAYQSALQKPTLSHEKLNVPESSISDFFINTLALWNEIKPKVRSLKNYTITALITDEMREKKYGVLADLDASLSSCARTIEVFDKTTFGKHLKKKINFSDKVCFSGIKEMAKEVSLRVKAHRGLALALSKNIALENQFYLLPEKKRKLIFPYIEQFILQFQADPASYEFRNVVANAITTLTHTGTLKNKVIPIKHFFIFVNEREFFETVMAKCDKLNIIVGDRFFKHLLRHFANYFEQEMKVGRDQIENDMEILKEEYDLLERIDNAHLLEHLHLFIECPEKAFDLYRQSEFLFFKVTKLNLDSSSVKEMHFSETLVDLGITLGASYSIVIQYLCGKKAADRSVNPWYTSHLEPLFNWCLDQLTPKFPSWNFVTSMFEDRRDLIGIFLRKVMMILLYREDLHDILLNLRPENYAAFENFLRDKDMLKVPREHFLG